ncbi:MAG: proline--tRNA ligase, partial [Actinobacteria bacterium]
IYSFLPMGKRTLAKVENIIREEMDAIGSQEVLMPVLQPADLWEKTGRWEEYGPEMMRIKDRNERDFALGPTHEELITAIVAAEVRSYKDLPQTLYQIQVKFRDEIRPRFGLMRAREFIMKDAYSFHTSKKDLDKTYNDMSKAYAKIVKRSGLKYRSVKAEGGIMGGEVTEEFMILASSGEEMLIYCNKCHYGANIEAARAKLLKREAKEKEKPFKPMDTPGKSSVEDVARYLKVETHHLAKTLIYLADSEPVLVVLPGDREANEAKIQKALGAKELRLFSDDDFKIFPHLVKGFVGPVDAKNKILADEEVLKMRNFVTGANEADVHYINVNYQRDFKADVVEDIKYARKGDICPVCDGSLETTRGIEMGHIFQLGKKYSKAMGATYLDKNGKSQAMNMGCYGIGVTRLLAAAVEQNHDDKGIIWPRNLAPFEVVIIQTDMREKKLTKAAEGIMKKLTDKGIEVAYDDREERAGVKFGDADLIGYPLQIILGKTLLEQGMVELKIRKTHKKEIFALEKTQSEVDKLLNDL